MNTALPKEIPDPVRGSDREWLEADGLGGFSSGTVHGHRTRRYHALLLTAQTPPTGRVVLVNGFEAWVETADRNYFLSSQVYVSDVVHPDGAKQLVSFRREPWPIWTYELDNGMRVEQSIFVPHRRPMVVMTWRLLNGGNAMLRFRPLISGRDYHALHQENSSFNFDASVSGPSVTWSPYPGVPQILSLCNGEYRHDPVWYRHFLYWDERNRGLDCVEDLASPGVFHWNLTGSDAVLMFTTAESQCRGIHRSEDVERLAANLGKTEENRRGQFKSSLHRAADAYVVKRGQGETIVAGYPWFTDWGRDTFIALRGLCSSAARIETARKILIEWSGAVSEGMLPNFFPDGTAEPEYNSVDASLWYIIAADEYLRRSNTLGQPADASTRRSLEKAINAILTGYSAGTRHGIRCDSDGLLASGERGVQLTWMDAKIGDWVVTPRIGKPVEVQALWLNALKIASEFTPRWREIYEKGVATFNARFWNEERGCLYDVIDADHESDKVDPSLRPNQIFAVGGLPYPIVAGTRAKRIVDVVERELLTPVGLRSLAPSEPDYRPHYEGGVWERDSAYHQGTVWPWLIGAFVEAWVRAHGDTALVRKEAALRFLPPLLEHLNAAGLGHVSEIADAEAPHTPRGCPFQAWSLGELIRLCVFLSGGDMETVLPASAERSEFEIIVHAKSGNEREVIAK